MGRSLARWIRTTFDYNPTFPLSALVLLVGLRLLARDGSLAPDPLGAGAGVGVLQAYELALLGTALLVLWPRRIAYETTSILIIFGVVRFAAPFLVIGLAADGHPQAAFALGLAVWLLMTGKVLAIRTKVGLSVERWELGYDALLYGLACLALPLLAYGLSTWTGDAISHATARALRLGVWWSAALLLAPLALGLAGSRPAAPGPLRSRAPAKVWRCLTALGSAGLLFNALWLGGEAPVPLALLPLAAVGLAIASALVRAAGGSTPTQAVVAPALALALVVLFPPQLLQGRQLILSHPVAALAVLGLAALAIPLIAPDRRRTGFHALGLVAAASPLRFASGSAAEHYLLAAAAVVAAVGLARRRDGLVTLGAVGVALVGAHLAWEAQPLRLLTIEGAVLAALVAWRLPAGQGETPLSARAALALAAGAPLLEAVRGAPGPEEVVLAVAGAGAVVLLAQRYREPGLRWLAAPVLALGPTRHLAGTLNPGAALVLLAFAALPAGAAIALRRERARDGEDPAEAPPERRRATAGLEAA